MPAVFADQAGEVDRLILDAMKKTYEFDKAEKAEERLARSGRLFRPDVPDADRLHAKARACAVLGLRGGVRHAVGGAMAVFEARASATTPMAMQAGTARMHVWRDAWLAAQRAGCQGRRATYMNQGRPCAFIPAGQHGCRRRGWLFGAFPCL